MAVCDRVVFPLQTISNLLSALREGDFSVRGRAGAFDDALGEVMREVNTLGGTLREQRLPRTGSHHAVAHGDVGDRRGRVCLRS